MTSLRHQLVEQLGKEIEAGELPSGSRLDERSLSKRFGISRTPAREVLLQLSAAGLVKFVPRHGAVVLSVSPEETVSMLEVLVALEGEAAALATRRMEVFERESFRATTRSGRLTSPTSRCRNIQRSTTRCMKRSTRDAATVS